MFPSLILASTSRYRRELLARLAVPFHVSAPEVDEQPLPGEKPEPRASRLALAKAHAVAERFPDAVVIGSDQVAACGELVLDKPGSAERARAQLASLSERTAVFYTACAVVVPALSTVEVFTDRTRIDFRKLNADEIARYVEREQPLDCAGSFKSEALGITLFETIETRDPSALVGLPLLWLAAALRRAGFALP